MKKEEQKIQLAISKWLKYQYPSVMFISESSGLRLPPGLAVQTKNNRSPEKGWNDTIILEPNSKYHGLLLEIKKDRNEVYKKDGELRTDEHNLEQQAFAERIKAKGYCYCYAFSVEDGINKINSYLTKAQ